MLSVATLNTLPTKPYTPILRPSARQAGAVQFGSAPPAPASGRPILKGVLFLLSALGLLGAGRLSTEFLDIKVGLKGSTPAAATKADDDAKKTTTTSTTSTTGGTSPVVSPVTGSSTTGAKLNLGDPSYAPTPTVTDLQRYEDSLGSGGLFENPGVAPIGSQTTTGGYSGVGYGYPR